MIKTWLALIVLVLADSAGNLYLTQGMKQVGAVSSLNPQEVWKTVIKVLSNPLLRLGIVCMAITFFMFIALLSWADLSFALPATALTEPVNMLGTKFVLKEKVTKVRWVSTVLICVGLVLISLPN
ncbi:EamA-like transporter family [Synechococcus sp. PCC 7502]|uniref:EamA family transporter n=1 Tax=Synechococcus sp. PCC 7502 TaxID=1173263 RepID=UPI00029FB64A|nr:EamA family transporter [Synechococcus sp. PCC 7502]AFY73301.1 EamA-like transporter family [Synechococcus sp. PCC 7502]